MTHPASPRPQWWTPQPIPSGTGTKNSVFTLVTWGRICALLLYLYLHRRKKQKFMLDSKGGGEGGMMEGAREGRGKSVVKGQRV